MVKKDITVQKKLFNTQDAAQCIQIAMQYDSELCIHYGEYRINPKSLMGLLCLRLTPGMKVVLTGEGKDENAAVSHLEAFLS